ncbi:MAG: hypothetical protein V4568_17125 [Pseudomonadota bacterium]
MNSRLELGNNQRDYRPDGYTRLTNTQAQYFTNNYEIVNHYPNDASGFSATLMKNKTTGEYTLSFRSTEYRNEDQGGDWSRDGIPGADGNLHDYGFAFAQIDSMEKYYAKLQADGTLPANAVLNVTGYSLGGHLATVFTELHTSEINHTYTFNGAGEGAIRTPDSTISTMLNYYRDILANPGHGLADVTATYEDKYNAAIDTSGPLNSANIYQDSRHQWAAIATSLHFGTSYAALFGTIKNSLSDKITQLYGHATHDDTEYTANTGIHAPGTSIFIEDQPNLVGFGGFFGSSGDFGTTHSLTLISDSLALMSLFQSADPTLQQQDIEKLFSAASNQRGQGSVTESGSRGETDSLENALNALSRALGINGADLVPDQSFAGFGNIAKRNEFYDRMEEVRGVIGSGNYRIVSLSGINASNLAMQDDADALAYRYALKELNPFAVLGVDYATLHNDGSLDLYDSQTGKGTITETYLQDRAAFLARKLYFAENNLNNDYVNPINKSTAASPVDSSGNTYIGGSYYEDRTTGYIVLQDPKDGGNLTKEVMNQFVFDNDDGETIEGDRHQDHLYGGGGDDTLKGGAENDYLEGGSGADTLNGDADNDTLFGGADDDTLTGGKGNDVLEGGKDFDTYIYQDGDGFDTIRDTDGKILYDGNRLAGGNKIGTGLYQSTDKAFTYSFTGDLAIGVTLLVTGPNGKFIIENFKNNDLGIDLIGEATVDPITTTRTITGDFGPMDFYNADGSVYHQYDDLGNLIQNLAKTGPRDDTLYGSAGADRINGRDGSDVLYGKAGTDLIEGGKGTDIITGDAGNDELFATVQTDINGVMNQIADQATHATGDWITGGLGEDTVVGDIGDDILLGGGGKDLIVGGAGDDLIDGDQDQLAQDFNWTVVNNDDPRYADDPFYRHVHWATNQNNGDQVGGADTIYGGSGSDVVYGFIGDDRLFGDDGNDTITGGDGSDTIYGGIGDDLLTGDNNHADSDSGGSDYIDGGEGNDRIQGEDGSDTLFGDAGNDTIFGGRASDDWATSDTGENYIDGEDGDDKIYGTGSSDTIFGGAGNDTLFAGDGTEYLDGEDGDDVIYGGKGNNTLVAGDGNDKIIAGDGDTTIYGGGGTDLIFGGAGKNIIYAGNGGTDANPTQIVAGNGDTTIYGGNGINHIFGGAGKNVIYAGDGGTADHATYVVAGTGQSNLYGGNGYAILDARDNANDIRMFAGDGDNALLGGSGNDTLVAGSGEQYLDGGAGTNTYIFDGNQSDVFIAQKTGSEILRFGPGITASDLQLTATMNAGSVQLQINAGSGTITVDGGLSGMISGIEFANGSSLSLSQLMAQANAASNSVSGTNGDLVFGANGDETLTGSAGDDTIVSASNGNTLIAGSGNDQLHSYGDNDVLIGGSGTALLTANGSNATLIGGTGNDTFVVHNADTIIQEAPNQGNNTVRSSISYVLPENVQNLTLTGNDDLTATGNDTDGVITGNSGNHTLIAGSGNETLVAGSGIATMTGGSGNNTFVVNKTTDIVSEAQNASTDTVISSVSYVLPENVEKLTLTGFADLTATGNAQGGTLVANDGNTTLIAGAGMTTMIGGAGDNTFVVRNTSDVVIKQPNQGSNTVLSSVDYVLPENVQNLTLTGNANLVAQGNAQGGTLTGNSGNDTLIAGEGGTTLISGTGIDTLIGGAGNDTFVVNNAADVVIQAPDGGINTVITSVNYVLPENVQNMTLTGAANLSATGNDLDNVLTANNGDSTLFGGVGSDTLIGGSGHTIYMLARGGDMDTIATSNGQTNTISLASSLSFTDLTMVRAGDDLLVKVAGSNDGFLIQNYAANSQSWNIVAANASPAPLATVFDQIANSQASFNARLDTLKTAFTAALTNELRHSLEPSYTDGNGDWHQNTVTIRKVTTTSDAPGISIDEHSTRNSNIQYLGTEAQTASVFSTATTTTYQFVPLANFITGTSTQIPTGAVLVYGDSTLQQTGSHSSNARTILGYNIPSGTTQQTTGGTLTEYRQHHRYSITDYWQIENVQAGDSANAISLGGVGIVDGGKGDDLITSAYGYSFTRLLSEQIRGNNYNLLNSFLDGGEGNDTIIGGWGSFGPNGLRNRDVLVAGSGSDFLNGGTGADRYLTFADAPSGWDTIFDSGANVDEYGGPISAAVPTDVVQFDNGIQLSDLHFGWSYPLAAGNRLALDISWSNGGGIHVVLPNANDPAGVGIEQFQFANGTTMTIAQMLTHAPQRPSQIPQLFQVGMGEQTWNGNSAFIQFDSAISVSDVHASRSDLDLLLSYNDRKDVLRLVNWYANPNAMPTLPATFSDGTVFSYNDFAAKGFDIYGSHNDDIFNVDALSGTNQKCNFYGEYGNDTYLVNNAGNAVFENANEGNDTIIASVNYALSANVENLTLTGSANLNATGNDLDNILNGNSGNNVLDGGMGADILTGGLGNDTYIVDSANDAVIEKLNEGTDTVQSSATYTLAANVENLTLIGTTAIDGIGNTLNNILIGNGAANTLNGGIGADTMRGGLGDDTYAVDNISDIVTENTNEGNDTVQSSLTYTLGNNIENLTLTGTTGINSTGNALDNVLRGNSAANTLTGGAGNDAYYVSTGDTITETVSAGTDTVIADIAWTLGSNLENLTFAGTAAINGTGNTLANVINGNSAANILDGGTGIDTLRGGLGNDTYVVDNVGDVVTELAGEGADLIQSSVTYALSANIENLTLTGNGTINGTGNELDNILIGNSGANTLTGGAGNDTLSGGTGADKMLGGIGNDAYVVDNTSDVVTENLNEGTDVVQSSVAYTLGNNLENLTLTGTSAIGGTGNALDNILIGNSGKNTLTGKAGNDRLDGGAGVDKLIGGLGNDTYVVDNTSDVITENASEGTDNVESSITYTLGSNLENLFLTGTTAINATGNTLNNLLTGNSAINTLNGGAGNDIMQGGAGADLLTDTAGNNLFNGGSDNDTLAGGTGNELYIGGTGNDSITTNTGKDVIAFNKGDGQDTIAASTGLDNTISLGGGIRYQDLLFSKSGNDLILNTGGGDSIKLANWYAATTNHSVDTLQMITEATANYNPSSTDPLLNHKVDEFNFDGLVSKFDAARAANSTLTTWALSQALLDMHLSSSDSAAIGGDLAYQYGKNGNLSLVGSTGAQNVLANAQFGSSTPQTLQSSVGLQEGIVKLA